MTTPQQASEGFVATEIIRAWKSSDAIRAEFGLLSRYSAFVQGIRIGRINDPKGAHHALMPESVPRLTPATPAPTASVPAGPATVPAVVVAHCPTVLPVKAPVSPPKMTSPYAVGNWLSERYKLHFRQSHAKGMSYGDACMEARRLAELDRQAAGAH